MPQSIQTLGPLQGQIVLYNNGGTIVPAVVVNVDANGRPNLVYISGTGTYVTSIPYNPALVVGSWAFTPIPYLDRIAGPIIGQTVVFNANVAGIIYAVAANGTVSISNGSGAGMADGGSGKIQKSPSLSGNFNWEYLPFDEFNQNSGPKLGQMVVYNGSLPGIIIFDPPNSPGGIGGLVRLNTFNSGGTTFVDNVPYNAKNTIGANGWAYPPYPL